MKKIWRQIEVDSNSKYRVWRIQLFQLRVTAEWKTPPFSESTWKKKTIACESEYLRLGGVCDSYARLGPSPKRFSTAWELGQAATISAADGLADALFVQSSSQLVE